MATLLTSLPMRERELKLPHTDTSIKVRRSLPMRERELKRHLRPRQARPLGRSPCGSVN